MTVEIPSMLFCKKQMMLVVKRSVSRSTATEHSQLGRVKTTRN